MNTNIKDYQSGIQTSNQNIENIQHIDNLNTTSNITCNTNTNNNDYINAEWKRDIEKTFHSLTDKIIGISDLNYSRDNTLHILEQQVNDLLLNIENINKIIDESNLNIDSTKIQKKQLTQSIPNIGNYIFIYTL